MVEKDWNSYFGIKEGKKRKSKYMFRAYKFLLFAKYYMSEQIKDDE